MHDKKIVITSFKSKCKLLMLLLFLVPQEEDDYDNPRMENPKQPGPKEPVSFKRPARSYNTDKNFPI